MSLLESRQRYLEPIKKSALLTSKLLLVVAILQGSNANSSIMTPGEIEMDAGYHYFWKGDYRSDTGELIRGLVGSGTDCQEIIFTRDRFGNSFELSLEGTCTISRIPRR